MNLYFDTSALIKFFHTEEGTDFNLISDVDWYFVSTDNTLYDVVIAAGLKAMNPLKM